MGPSNADPVNLVNMPSLSWKLIPLSITPDHNTDDTALFISDNYLAMAFVYIFHRQLSDNAEVVERVVGDNAKIVIEPLIVCTTSHPYLN